jgi:pimeloyl-ACP methyl ester carboxylesterase
MNSSAGEPPVAVDAAVADAADHVYQSPDGLRLYCRVYPAKTPGRLPVLCLPGLTRNSRDFARLAAHLQPLYEVLAADLRGRGRSDWDPNPAHYQVPTYVADVWALLQSRGLDRVMVIGTSLGALLGQVLAAMQPAKIAAIVLNDAGPELDPVGLRRIAGYAGKLPPVSSWDEAAAQAKSVYGLALPDLTADEWLAYARQGYRENAEGRPMPDMDPAISKAFGAPSAAAADLWPLFAQIKSVPMLVIRGASSDILSAATVERMAREKPDLETLTVANRGHTPLLTERECLAAIDDFLARHGRQ